MIIGDSTSIHLQDPTGLGRWSGLTFGGKNGFRFTLITAYQVCRGSASTTSIGSSFNREHNYFKNQGHLSPNPWQQLFNSLLSLVHQLSASPNHSVVVMLDANSALSDDTAFQEFVSEAQLFDLHSSTAAPSTYIGAPNRRIDYIFGCHRVLRALQRSGSLSYYDGPHFDHRGFVYRCGL